MKVLHDLLSDSNGTISTSSESANNPSSNVRNTILAEYLEFTGKTSETLSFYFADAITIDCVGLVTNLTDSGSISIAVYEEKITDGGSASSTGPDIVDGGSASSVGPDILDGNQVPAITQVFAGSDATERNLIFYVFDQSYEVSEIVATFADSTNTENIQINRLVYGLSSAFGKFQPKLTEDMIDTGIGEYGRAGALYGTIGYQYLQWKFSPADLTRSQRALLKEWQADVGTHTPFFIDFTEDTTLYEPDYVSFVTPKISLVLQNWLNHTGNLNIRQAF